MLIICDPVDTEYDQIKPKRPLDVIGISVSSEVNAFTGEPTRIRFPSASRKENLVDPEKGFSINVPCVQKVFKFYARLDCNIFLNKTFDLLCIFFVV